MLSRPIKEPISSAFLEPSTPLLWSEGRYVGPSTSQGPGATFLVILDIPLTSLRRSLFFRSSVQTLVQVACVLQGVAEKAVPERELVLSPGMSADASVT